MLWLLARSSAWNRENGDFERKWGHFGDPKTEKVLMGTPGPKWGPTWEQCIRIQFFQVAWRERKSLWMCSLQIAQFLSGVFWSCFILVTWLVTMWPTCNSFINPWNALWPTASLIKNPEQHDFEAPFSPGLGPLLLKIQPPFGPSSKILGSPSQLVKA